MLDFSFFLSKTPFGSLEDSLFASSIPCTHIPLHMYLFIPAKMSVKSAKGGLESRPPSAARSVRAN